MNRLIPTILAVVLLSTACAPREVRLCDRKCECEGCSEREFDQCVDGHDDDFRKADREDCVREHDELLACQNATWFCDGDDFKTDCEFEKDDFKRCVD